MTADRHDGAHNADSTWLKEGRKMMMTDAQYEYQAIKQLKDEPFIYTPLSF